MAVAAGDFHVTAFEREIRAHLMVKQRRLPSRRMMATVAGGIGAAARELSGMNVLVAAFALLGSGFVNHVLHGDFQVRWLMAIDARDRTVSARKQERRSGMIELQLLRPCGSIVAGFTTPRRPGGALRLHSLGKLAAVRVRMAGRTG